MVRSHVCVSSALFVLLALGGCIADETPVDPASMEEELGVALATPVVLVVDSMTFTTRVVTPAMHFVKGLYEPTIDVSNTGVLYISAHTIAPNAGGAPAYYSNDDGATWTQLPITPTGTSVPGPIHGGTPGPSDEIFIVAGTDGTAWGVDISLATFSVNGWCDDGATHCYTDPNAYDRTATASTCAVASLNDRPWAAYANGTLLMVNNAGGGPVQVGAMQVPPALYANVGNPVTGPTWNMCAGSGGGLTPFDSSGAIPGIPDIRPDGFFAVPQFQGRQLNIVTGYASDVMTVKEFPVFESGHASASAIGQYGIVSFDAEGTMYVAAMNNTGGRDGATGGGIRLATSHDDGATFTEHAYTFDQPVTSVYLDANKWGKGAMINWGLVDGEHNDWYIGRLGEDAGGSPHITEASLAIDDGPVASRHVQGAALGPDGRSYMIMSEVSGNNDAEGAMQTGITPLVVVYQNGGPVLDGMVDVER